MPKSIIIGIVLGIFTSWFLSRRLSRDRRNHTHDSMPDVHGRLPDWVVTAVFIGVVLLAMFGSGFLIAGCSALVRVAPPVLFKTATGCLWLSMSAMLILGMVVVVRFVWQIRRRTSGDPLATS